MDKPEQATDDEERLTKAGCGWGFAKGSLGLILIGVFAMLGMIALHLLWPHIFPDPTR